jgi:hypothetical protein
MPLTCGYAVRRRVSESASEAESLAQRKALGQRTEAAGAGLVTQICGGGANADPEPILHRHAFMPPKEDSGGKRVASTSGSLDVVARQLDTAVLSPDAITSKRATAFRIVNNDAFANARVE